MSIWQKLAVAVTGLVVLGGTAAPAGAAVGADAASLDALVRERSAAVGVPGAAYAVVGPGGVEHRGMTGRDGDGRAVTTGTPFLWGSVSKPVTATLVVRLAQTGRLSLDDRVVDLLPAFTTADPAAAARVTVRQLLDHTSGLPEGLELTDRTGPGRSPATLVQQIARLHPVAAPGADYHYSSLGYVVLGAVVEAVTGRSFADVLRREAR